MDRNAVPGQRPQQHSEADTRPLRILHLSDILFEEKPGGSRQVARELLRELNKAGHRTTLLVGTQNETGEKTWKNAEQGEIAQYYKGASPTEWLQNGRLAAEKLIAAAEKEGQPFDVLHTHFAYSAVGPLRAVNGRIPHIRSFYGPWDAEGWVEDSGLTKNAPLWKKPLLYTRAVLKRKYRHSVEAQNLAASKYAVILSEQSRGEVEEFGYPAQNIVKIPGGVNRDRFQVDITNPQARTEARERVGLPTDAFPLLLSIRRLVPRMGLENLVAVFPKIKEAFPKARLVIGGTGALADTLKAQAKALGVADSVIFAGFIPDEHVVDYYRSADAFVLPTLSLEGFGLVTVEALACGTPVIATPVGAIPEVLGDLDKRLLAGGTSADELGKAILDFCYAKQQAGSWVNDLTAARLCGYVDDRYTWAKHAQGVEAVYRRAVNR